MPTLRHALKRQQQDGDRDHRRAEDHDQAGRVVRPEEERHAKPRHARRAHRVNRDDEIQSGQDRRETVDEDSQAGRYDVRVRESRTVRRVERPAGIDAAGEQRVNRDHSAEQIDVPAQKIDSRKSEILRSDHHRDEEVPQRRRYRRDEEEKDHDDAVLGKDLVVSGRLQEIALRSQQFEANHQRVDSADEKEESDGPEIKQSDALVILGQQPRLQPVLGVDVVDLRWSWYFE